MTDFIEDSEIPKAMPMEDVPDTADLPDFTDEEIAEEYGSYVDDTSIRAYELGLERCRDIATETFTSEVLGEWYDMSKDERVDLINTYGHRIADVMGIDFRGLVFDVTETGVLGYNSGDGYVHLAEYLVKEPGQIVELIDTVSHELRHQFQYEAYHDPEKFGIDEQTAREWRLAWEVYYTQDPVSNYDPIGYKYNPLETDARNCGEAMAQAVVRGWYKDISVA